MYLYLNKKFLSIISKTIVLNIVFLFNANCQNTKADATRIRFNINDNWRFMRYTGEPDKLMYDVRPEVSDRNDSKVADSKPTEAVQAETSQAVLKKWILPTSNDFIKEPSKKHIRPSNTDGTSRNNREGGNSWSKFPFIQANFNDNTWEKVDLPHDWAIKAPFYTGNKPEVGGGMGRLPSHGVAWYRKKLAISAADKGKIIYLDIDGAMSYSMVWLNGNLVGGWAYGYNSYRLDLTPYLNFGGENQVSIRLDNPNHSARWYPGGGIYRNVWLTKVAPVHVGQWGTQITTLLMPSASSRQGVTVSADKSTIKLALKIENKSASKQKITAQTEVYLLDEKNGKKTAFPISNIDLNANESKTVENVLTLNNAKLWGVYPQKAHLYVAHTRLFSNGKLIDDYKTTFGIRDIKLDAIKGLIVNGEPVILRGVNQHHDLGALGAAFNVRAAERQLEMLRELGCNAIRMSHNPPAPELLDLTDKMGFLVIDEIFDSWERKKTPHDFHLIFPDWHEADTRSFIRRDRNHPSVFAWSFGNEVGEQYTEQAGADLAQKLINIVHEEDPTRPASASQNYAKPDMPFTKVMDFINLNYQGEGIRDAPAYAHLKGIRTTPLYPAFQKVFPNKMIVSTETASALSTRGTYIFPVSMGNSAPVSDSTGGDPIKQQVSAYELYTAAFGSSADKVFASQDRHPFVAGEFVWTGWDYLGEPTPYYTARSSYSGIIDLAGFKKDRFYLYQARWRPDLPMAHILPHWNWADRVGQITPIHVFTSGDEAEVFLNGKSLGRKKKGAFEYRLRWDDAVYEAGEVKVIAYKNGQKWAEDGVKTTEKPSKIHISADRSSLKADGQDLVFVTVKITDKNGLFVPDANLKIKFTIEGAGEIVATDNGDPADLVSFASPERATYNGLALAIIKAKKGSKGVLKLTVQSEGLGANAVNITIR